TPMVLLVPKGDLAREEELVQDLDDLAEVKNSISYVGTIGSAIPPEYLNKEETKSFFSKNYSRITLNTTTATEGDEAFALVEKVKQIAENYYGEDYHA